MASLSQLLSFDLLDQVISLESSSKPHIPLVTLEKNLVYQRHPSPDFVYNRRTAIVLPWSPILRVRPSTGKGWVQGSPGQVTCQTLDKDTLSSRKIQYHLFHSFTIAVLGNYYVIGNIFTRFSYKIEKDHFVQMFRLSRTATSFTLQRIPKQCR